MKMVLIRRVALAIGLPAFLVLLGLVALTTCAPLPVARTPSSTMSQSAPPIDRPQVQAPRAPTSTPATTTLAAVFAPWYGYDPATGNCQGGLGSYHWNNDPDMTGVVDVPERGYYCSASPEIIEWQLDGLERAGVQTLFISWWGWGDGDLDRVIEGQPDAYMNQGITALLDQLVAVTGTHRISVSLIVEPFVKTQAGMEPRTVQASQRAMMLDWLWTNYYGNDKYRDVWFQWEGKPLLIAFDPMTLTLPLSATYPISYTIRNWTGRPKDNETMSEGWHWFFGPPQDPVDGMSSDGVAFVYPRFDEVPARLMGAAYITWPPRSIDPRLTQCAYERQWQQLAEHRSEIKMVVLYGWNLYGEQAYLEPARAIPPRPSIGHSYVERTREYYESLAAGRAIVPAGSCVYSSGFTPRLGFVPRSWR